MQTYQRILSVLCLTAICVLGNAKHRNSRYIQFSPSQPSVDLPLPAGLNLDNYCSVDVVITNQSDHQAAIEGCTVIEGDDSFTVKDGVPFYDRTMIVLDAGETDTMKIFLSRDMSTLPEYMHKKFPGMYGFPGGFLRRKVNEDLSRVTHVRLFQMIPDTKITVQNLSAGAPLSSPTEEEVLSGSYFPIIDRFGQFIYRTWPGKVTNVNQIHEQRKAEEQELNANPGASTWDCYGGWQGGPKMNATGHFYVKKVEGKWWLIDPLGNLFWSQGINCVSTRQTTRTEGREYMFSYLPPYDDFYMNNLLSKYSDNEKPLDEARRMVPLRLRSWGINTMAANTERWFCKHAQVPYTIELRTGIPGKVPEAIDSSAFRKQIKQIFVEKFDVPASAEDPFCIGYFVDNEYGWPESTNARQAITDYFRIIRDVLQELAPHKLYLGCRSNSPNFNRMAFEIEAQFCDVISINHYDYNFTDFDFCKGLDCPLMIGEFHFGALDRGLDHTGLRSASSQKQRARIYQHFIDQCLTSDQCIGAHWFQYADQPYTGRFDGENYQIGFVDVCDRPHKELIEASRQIASYMYQSRFGMEMPKCNDISGFKSKQQRVWSDEPAFTCVSM